MLIKGFDENLKCRDMQFEVGKIYEVEGEPKLCENGFHYCDSIVDVHSFYDLHKKNNNRFCEILALGEIDYSTQKSCTNKIKIIREIIGEELEKLRNLGKYNLGLFNTGDGNTGHWNTGHWNTGDNNTSDGNTGDFNTGDGNTGHKNTGNFNTGHRNTGDFNTGNFNTGHRNTGDWNTGDYSNGMFCTHSPKINIFNIPSDMTYLEFRKSEYYKALTSVQFHLTQWIYYTKEEKETDETKELIGGYLKEYTYKEACVNWWNKMSENNKLIIQNMPNFDAEIFEEITGIKL